MKKKTKLKILLCKLPAPEFSFLKKWGNVPLGIGYLKAMAHKEKLIKYVNIKILEYSKNDLSGDAKLIDTILSENPDIVGLSLYEWNSLRSLYIAKKIKQKLQKVKIIVGGPEVTREDSAYIMNCDAIDIGCIGEGEFTFIEIIKHCLNGSNDYSDIKGISYRKGDEVRLTPERERIKRLDYIPSPYLLGIINPRDYSEVWLETSRGCVNKCSYCVSGSQPLISFSSGRSYKEIKYLMGENIKLLRILDNDFISTPNFKTTCLFLKDSNRKKKVHIQVWFQADRVNEDAIKLMKNTGIKSVEIGLQTINPVSLSEIHRKLNLANFVRGMKLLKDGKFESLIDLIIGLPGDRLEDIQRTLKFCKDKEYDVGRAPFVLEILPGTELKKCADKYKIKYRKEPPYLTSNSRYLSRKDIKKALSLFNYKGYDYPIPDLVTYSNPKIFNETEATIGKSPFINVNNINKKIDALLTTLILTMDYNFQTVNRLKLLGQTLSRNVANPLTIWVKNKSIERALGLIKALFRPISEINPFLLCNIILETSNEFPTSIIVDIKKSLKLKEKIFDHSLLYEPINLVVMLPWGSNDFNKKWLDNLCKYAKFLWYLDFSEKDEWESVVKDIFKEERNSPFLLDFVRHSNFEFVIKVKRLITKESFKKQNAKRYIIFRNSVLNHSVRTRVEGFKLYRPEKLVGSKLIFDKRLNVSSVLKENPKNILDSIEWQKNLRRVSKER